MAKMNGNKTNKGQGFEKNKHNINRKGVPPKLLTGIIREMNDKGYERVSAANIIEAYETLLNLPLDMLTELAKDDRQPMFVRIVVKAMLSNKGFEMIERMLDRAHGKAKQQTDITTGGQQITAMPDLSKYKYEELIKLLHATRTETDTTPGDTGGA